jgi:chromosome segregation ATPase
VKLRDRWSDRGRIDDDAVAELKRLAGRLEDRRAQLSIAEGHVETCELAEAELEQLLAAEFSGDTAPDTAAATRREVVGRAVAAREIRDEALELVRVGVELCEQKVDEIGEQRIAAAREERGRVETEIRVAEERIEALNGALRFIAEKIESWSSGGEDWARLRRLFDPRAYAYFTQHMDKQRAPRPSETADETARRHAAETADVLNVQTRDPDGNVIPAYSRLDTGGGPVRLPR